MAVAAGTAATFSVRPAAAPGARHCACAAAAAGGARFRSDGCGGGAGKWWAPQPAPEPAAAAGARRFGVLTEEKARQLRVRMMETQSFHDAMYHSAIASRLASAAPGHDGTKAP